MLLPDERIGGNAEQRLEVSRPKWAQLQQVADEGGLAIE
jgi:hypothetical protein